MTSGLQTLQALCAEIGCEYRVGESMRAHTSFKIGGPADLFLIPDSADQIARLLKAAKASAVELCLIGRGSDLLVSDTGIRGAVLVLSQKLSDMRIEEDGRTLWCEAGASLELLCKFALEHGLTGLEFAYGIPGSVGGAIYMNAGAYGGEMKDIVQSVEYLTEYGERLTVRDEALDFTYRHSVFSGTRDCILSARFRLALGDREAIRARMNDLKRRRREKQPLEYPSAGSTFKRPLGGYASALIDECGLKGLRVGGAMVSEKHAGFLINFDGASCCDVLELIERVQTIVREKTGFNLECEVKIL